MNFFNLVQIIHIPTTRYSLKIYRVLSNSLSDNLVSSEYSKHNIKIISQIINVQLHVNIIVNDCPLNIIALEMSLLCDIQQMTILSKHFCCREDFCCAIEGLAECVQCRVG